MRLVDISLDRPQENLALDEVLLNGLESGRSEETLRFWESPTPFVVLGVSQVLRDEVNLKECHAANVPIMRRCSAGGCVLQGPGSLNFALTLRRDTNEALRTIRDSYCFVLNTIADAFQERGIPAKHKGTSDLAIGGKKISGNAQRRRRDVILHHGTILYDPDVEGMQRFLREPKDRPQYRGDRTHRRFVDKVHLPAEEIRQVIAEAFGLSNPYTRLERWEMREMRELGREKYLAHTWIYRR